MLQKINSALGTLSEKDIPTFLEHYNKALHLYKKRYFKNAIEIFKKALELKADDYPCLLYIERCEHYIKSPPPEDWDGVTRLTSK